MVVLSMVFYTSMDVQPFCHKKFFINAANYCRHVAKEFIHTMNTVISTFRFSDLYIKTYCLTDKLKYDSISFMEA